MQQRNIRGRTHFNQIRQKLKSKSIFKINTRRIELDLSTEPTSAKPFHDSGPHLHEETEIHKNISQFDEKFTVLDKIGEGANAVVKKCQSKQDGQLYAVKISRIDPEHVVYLKRAFKYVKLLKHPNIIKYHSLYLNLSERKCNLVMQYVSYPALSRYRQLLSQPELKTVARQLLETLDYLHEQKICHRDIKTDNILYDDQEKKVYLIDFGICKKYIDRGKTRQMWTPTGTTSYKAPQMFQAVGYSELVDVWAVGIVLYELVTGKRPFDEEYLSDTIEKIRNIDYVFNEADWPQELHRAKGLVYRLLKDKQTRLTANEALKAPWFLEGKTSTNSTLQNLSGVLEKRKDNKGEEMPPLLCRKNTMFVKSQGMDIIRNRAITNDVSGLVQAIESLRAENDIIIS